MQVHQVAYGVSADIKFVLYDTNGANIIVTPTFQSGDVLITLDGQAATSAVNLPSTLTNSYVIRLTSAETTCRQAVVTLIDTTPSKTWLDTSFVIETYGTSASYHPEIGNLPSSIDGSTPEEVFSDIIAMVRGKITKTGDTYVYYQADGVTPAFIVSAGLSGRIPL